MSCYDFGVFMSDPDSSEFIKSTNKVPYQDLFSRYVDDNQQTLTGISIIATIAALFLNINGQVFTGSLRSLQLLLLLFLFMGLTFLLKTSVTWFSKKADSWAAGIVVFTIGCTILSLGEFILSNFRTELNYYLIGICVLFIFALLELLNEFRAILDEYVRIKIKLPVLKSLIFGLVSSCCLYALQLAYYIYYNFSYQREVSLLGIQLILRQDFTWMLSVWIIAYELFMGCIHRSQNIKKRFKLFMRILLLVTLAMLIFYSLMS